MLKIRLQRVGRKHEPSFRLVLTDSKNSTKSGRFTEVLGSYDPRAKRENTEVLKADRIRYLLSHGAEPTASVNNLLVRKGVIRGKKIDVSAVSKKVSVEAPKKEIVEPKSDTIKEVSVVEENPE